MHMPMGFFLRRSISDVFDFHVEMEGLTCHRVVRIYNDLAFIYFFHADDQRTCFRLGLKFHARSDFNPLREVFARHFEHQVLVKFAVAIGGFYPRSFPQAEIQDRG
jgi:hypothetical protein